MWKGYEASLISYGQEICKEWIRRGYKDTCLQKISTFSDDYPNTNKKPNWLGQEEFHRAHRSNLLRKNYEYYSQFFLEPSDLPYIWPEELLNKK